jgi:hypothetical protein
MLNRDKPIGQRRTDGWFFGLPPINWPRARNSASVTKKRESFGWTDRTGQPHGRSGDKLARKAAKGALGIRT